MGVIEINTTTIILIATTVVFALLNILSFFGGISYRRKISEAELGSAEERAKKIIEDAEKNAKARKRELMLEAKEENQKIRAAADAEIKDRRREISNQERRVNQKEENLDKKTEALERKDQILSQKIKELEKKDAKIDEIKQQQIKNLEEISGMTREEAKQKAQSALTLVGLQDKAQENPYDLELSERKMVAIASVVAMDTQVVIFDAQDYPGKEKIKQLIRQLSENGRMVIAILHDMDFVAESFQRVIAMAHGKVIADGTPQEVFSRPDVLEKARLELPYVSALCQSLGFSQIFLKVEDFIEFCKR